MRNRNLIFKVRIHSKSKLWELYSAYSEIFSLQLNPKPAKIKPFTLEVDDTKWQAPKNNSAPRPQSIPDQLELQSQIKELLSKGVITESQEVYNSQVHLVPKPNGKKRFCIDFRTLNHNTKSMETTSNGFERCTSTLSTTNGQHSTRFTTIRHV